MAPGTIDVDLHDLGCDFYDASAHKWLLSPKGVGIFYARQASQKFLKPLVVARGWEDRSIRRFENYNTRNLPEVLGLAFDFQNLVGSARRTERILDLKEYLRWRLADHSVFAVKTPASDQLSAGITTVELIDHNVRVVATALADRRRIDCRLMVSHGLNGLHISLSIFNSERHVDVLVDALREFARSG